MQGEQVVGGPRVMRTHFTDRCLEVFESGGVVARFLPKGTTQPACLAISRVSNDVVVGCHLGLLPKQGLPRHRILLQSRRVLYH